MITIQGVALYTTAEICGILQVSLQTVTRMRSDGRLKYTQVGKAKMISADALNDYLTGKTERTSDKAQRRISEYNKRARAKRRRTSMEEKSAASDTTGKE